MLHLQEILLSKAGVYWSMEEQLPVDLHVEMGAAGIIVEEAHYSFMVQKFKEEIYDV